MLIFAAALLWLCLFKRKDSFNNRTGDVATVCHTSIMNRYLMQHLHCTAGLQFHCLWVSVLELQHSPSACYISHPIQTDLLPNIIKCSSGSHCWGQWITKSVIHKVLFSYVLEVDSGLGYGPLVSKYVENVVNPVLLQADAFSVSWQWSRKLSKRVMFLHRGYLLTNSLDQYWSAASFTKSYAVINPPIRSKANLLSSVLSF